MIIPVEVRYYNKRYLTPLVGRIALSSRGPFCIICHVGRRTGKPYATLLIAFAASFGFVIALTYGPEGGDTGGYIVAEGTSEQVAGVEASFTGQFLKDILSSAPLTKVYN